MSINIPEHIAKRWCLFLREKLFWLERLVDLELDLVHMAAATLSPSRYTVLSHSVVSDSLRPHGLYSLPGSSESMEILQARILEWVAMPSSKRSSQCRDGTHVSCIADGFLDGVLKEVNLSWDFDADERKWKRAVYKMIHGWVRGIPVRKTGVWLRKDSGWSSLSHQAWNTVLI